MTGIVDVGARHAGVIDISLRVVQAANLFETFRDFLTAENFATLDWEEIAQCHLGEDRRIADVNLAESVLPAGMGNSNREVITAQRIRSHSHRLRRHHDLEVAFVLVGGARPFSGLIGQSGDPRRGPLAHDLPFGGGIHDLLLSFRRDQCSILEKHAENGTLTGWFEGCFWSAILSTHRTDQKESAGEGQEELLQKSTSPENFVDYNASYQRGLRRASLRSIIRQ